MSKFPGVIALLCACCSCGAATVQQMTLDRIAQSATAIVRARVAGSTSSYTGSTIYTHYKLRITETYKGVPAAEVMLPGGVANGYRQSFPGVPTLQSGTEYVLFLWTSQSTGITHVVGLTQGILEVGQATGGTFRVGRPGTGESLLDSSGRPVKDAGIEMALSDLKTRIRTASETTPAPGASK